jgi:RNA polymerase I-specific transcription initiation factor RRN6
VDPAVLVYRLNLKASSGITIADPTILGSSSTGNPTDSTGVSALQISAVDTKGSFNVALQRALFFNMATLHKDLSLKQTLHVTSATEDSLPELTPPTWERDLTKSVHIVSDDDFIVDDEDVDETQTETLSVEPVSNFAMRLREQAQADPRDWTVQYDHAVRRLNNVDVTDVTDIDEVLEVVQETLRESEVDKTLPFGIVRELAEGEITLQDIESVSARLEKLLSDHAGSLTGVTYKDEAKCEDQGPQLTLRSMMLPSTLRIPGNNPSDRLRATVENILETWTPPATVNLSEIVRHSRAQLARRMGIEVCLASLIIRLEDPTTEQLPQNQSQKESQSQAWELPVRPGASPSSRTTPSLYFEASSQLGSSRLPTPSDSASVSGVTGSDPAIARLGRYTTFAGKPSLAPLPRRLNRVLAHWTIGADPASYDWASASRHFSRREDEEAEGEELTEKERARLQRRTERYVRRQRREAEETQRMQLLSSQVPEIVSGSQPGRLVGATSQLGVSGGESQSQSQNQGRSQPQAVASQVLPGRHGGRPPKKKKRKSGF